MAYYIFKLAVTAVLVVIISEIGKRNSMIGAVLASIPLVSVLAIIWIFIETRDIDRISTLSSNIFWLVLPSLAFFIALPLLLKQGVSFYPGIFIATGLTVSCYFLMVWFLTHFGVKL